MTNTVMMRGRKIGVGKSSKRRRVILERNLGEASMARTSTTNMKNNILTRDHHIVKVSMTGTTSMTMISEMTTTTPKIPNGKADPTENIQQNHTLTRNNLLNIEIHRTGQSTILLPTIINIMTRIEDIQNNINNQDPRKTNIKTTTSKRKSRTQNQYNPPSTAKPLPNQTQISPSSQTINQSNNNANKYNNQSSIILWSNFECNNL